MALSSDERLSQLVFLWSLVPLMAGCPSKKDDDDGASASMGPGTAGTDGGDDGSGTTAGMNDGGSATMPSTMSNGDGGTADTTSEGGGTTEYGYYDCSRLPTPKGPISKLCYGYAQKVPQCYGERIPRDCLAYVAGYCQTTIDEYNKLSPACGTAYEEFLACFNDLSCQEIMGRGGCGTELAAIEAACGK